MVEGFHVRIVMVLYVQMEGPNALCQNTKIRWLFSYNAFAAYEATKYHFASCIQIPMYNIPICTSWSHILGSSEP